MNVGAEEDGYGGYIRYLRLNFASILLALFGGAVAIFATGCWMLAAQLAPVAISAAEDVGAGAVHLAAGVAGAVTMETHKDDDLARAEAHAREDIMERGDSCDQLAAEVPGVIELRKSAAGAPEYRELGLVDSIDDAEWAPITYKGDADGGWRPAVNFLQMNFSPPLTGAIPDTDSNYLAYAPAQSISSAEADRLAALTSNFGKTAGTFSWSGRDYHYAVTRTLPCFPPPPERSAANNTPGS
jgi:hypothetical protein